MALVLSGLWVGISSSQPILESTPDLQKIDVIEHLGNLIPLDLQFRNTQGESVALSRYFHQGKPVILCMYYTNCPMLCSLVLTGLFKGVNELAWKPGNEFQMLSVSMDPEETFQTAASVKERYQGSLAKPVNPNAWEFLVGNNPEIHSLTDALGFKYFKDEKTGQFAHPAVVFILTETGKISRYLYGVEFKERDLRLALLEASQGKIGNTLDRIILYCYHYDPDAKGYVIMAMTIMKVGGLATALLLGAFLGFFWRRDQRKKALHS
jgi:protein SCO1